MKQLSTLILSFFCVFLSINFVTAQEDSTTYFSVEYMKVKPGMNDDYVKLENTWKKIHEARIKEGKSDGWFFFAVIAPSGTNMEYNYVTVSRFRGDKKLAGLFEGPYFPENWEALLSPEELAMVQKTEEYRDIVRTEIWSFESGVFADDWLTAKIHVFNYFKNRPGKTNADHTKAEVDIWKPLHSARVKDGAMKGWGLYNLEFPFGANTAYDSGTVDVYSNMEQYLSADFEGYFEKIHPGKDINKLFQQTSETAALINGEVRMLLNYAAGK